MQNPPIVLYGIKNCDSVKKARAWLDGRQIIYRFHDYRLDGLNPILLQQFIAQLGLETVLNQRSTSWRQLNDAQKQDLNPDKALQLMLDTPALIKRPILAIGTKFHIGFTPDYYDTLL